MHSWFFTPLRSVGIESVVDEKEGKSSGVQDAKCSSCEMAVVWVQNQIKRNQTHDHILNYINEVYVMYR